LSSRLFVNRDHVNIDDLVISLFSLCRWSDVQWRSRTCAFCRKWHSQKM